MKRFFSLAVLATVFCCFSSASAAEFARNVSRPNLAKMGLNRLQEISDADGSRVRGQGFTFVFGGGAVHAIPNGVYQVNFTPTVGGFVFGGSIAVAK